MLHLQILKVINNVMIFSKNIELKKLFIPIFILNSYMYGATHSFTHENDVFTSKEDSQYTGGLFYTYMDSMDKTKYIPFFKELKTDGAISFTNLIFTPKNKGIATPVLNDTPYAGYMKLNFLLYKSTKNYFHEFGANIGLVGPSTHSKELQSSFHHLIGRNKAAGWDNQLKNQLTAGISYQFAYKTDNFNIGNYKIDWTNNIRVEAGNFYSGMLVSTTIRISDILLNSFSTTGNFTVTDESNLLNFQNFKNFHWDISFGFFANKVSNYYIVDEARDLRYTIDEIDTITGEQVSYNIFYNDIKYSFTIKSVYLRNRPLSTADKQWGGLNITWKF